MGRAREKLQRLLAPRPDDAPDVVPREVTIAAPAGRALAPPGRASEPPVASSAEPAASRSGAPPRVASVPQCARPHSESPRVASVPQSARPHSESPRVASTEHASPATALARAHTEAAGARPTAPPAQAFPQTTSAGTHRRPPPPAHQMPPASAPLPARVTIGAATGAVRRGEFDAWRRARRAEVYLEAVPVEAVPLDSGADAAIAAGPSEAASPGPRDAGPPGPGAQPAVSPPAEASGGDGARAHHGRASAEELSLQRGLGAPRSAADHAVRAGIAAAAGRGGEATAYYERALALGLGGRAWWSAARHLAELYLEADRVGDALPVLEQLVREPSADPYPLLALASLVELESPSRAQTLRAQARRIAPWLATE